MFDHLEIKNFKSIEHLDIECRRINVLIGEPNTGKSNILEALGLISYAGHSETANDLREFVRYDDVSNLFYDDDLGRQLEIVLSPTYPVDSAQRIPGLLGPFHTRLQLGFSNGRFEGGVGAEGFQIQEVATEPVYVHNNPGAYSILGDHKSLNVKRTLPSLGSVLACKIYRFSPLSTFPEKSGDFLLPPSGDNLLSLMLQNRDLRAEANALLSSRGLRLGLRPQENKIEVIKALEDVIISQPYHLASDTFQRLVFYMAALRTNSDSVLVFEEPEAHAFPYYTKFLAERIALDEQRNQYFVSTHNPYFLLPIIEKTLSDDLAVFITYYEDRHTQVRQLAQDEIETIFDDVDVFSNIDMFLED